MKKIILLSLLMAVIFAACNKKDEVDPSYLSIGTIEKTGDLNSEFIINLDNGIVLTPIEISDDSIIDDARVVVGYCIAEKKSDDAFDVNIYAIDPILTKSVIQLTELNEDSIGNDPIHTNDNNIWVSAKHLNIVFNYYGYNKTHFVNLVRPIGEDTLDSEGRLILEFRHNANEDLFYQSFTGIVSFELESLRVADEESVDFVVRVIDFDNIDYEWEGSYSFKNPIINPLVNSHNSNLFEISTLNIK